MDTVLLTTSFELWDDGISHATTRYEAWRDRKTRRWMVRVPIDVARFFCHNAGFYPVPDQDADQ
jgi:hypothetical protein